MPKDLLVIVPSRGRAANIARLCGAFREPTRAQLLVCQDRDDPLYRQPDWVVQGPRKSFAGWVNEVAKGPIIDGYKYVGTFGDDHMPTSTGWSEAICEHLEAAGPLGMCYGDDLLSEPVFHRTGFCTMIFARASFWRALGKMAPEGMYQYVDLFWYALGTKLGTLAKVPGLTIEHLHWCNNKAVRDGLYLESDKHLAADMAEWDRYEREDLPADLERVRDLARV